MAFSLPTAAQLFLRLLDVAMIQKKNKGKG
jgi:hypothetical protein